MDKIINLLAKKYPNDKYKVNPFCGKNLNNKEMNVVLYDWGFLTIDGKNDRWSIWKGYLDENDKLKYYKILILFKQYINEHFKFSIQGFKSKDWYFDGMFVFEWPGITPLECNAENLYQLVELFKQFDKLSEEQLNNLFIKGQKNYIEEFYCYLKLKAENKKDEEEKEIKQKLKNNKFIAFLNERYNDQFYIEKDYYSFEENKMIANLGYARIIFDLEDECTVSIWTVIEELVGGDNECPNNPFEKNYSAVELHYILNQYLLDKLGEIPDVDYVINEVCCIDEELVGFESIEFEPEKIIKILGVIKEFYTINDANYLDLLLINGENNFEED